jgi:hypothetical protein
MQNAEDSEIVLDLYVYVLCVRGEGGGGRRLEWGRAEKYSSELQLLQILGL